MASCALPLRLVGVRRSLRRSVRSLGALVFAFMERVSFCTTPDFLLFLQIWLTKKVGLRTKACPWRPAAALTRAAGGSVWGTRHQYFASSIGHPSPVLEALRDGRHWHYVLMLLFMLLGPFSVSCARSLCSSVTSRGPQSYLSYTGAGCMPCTSLVLSLGG